MVVVNVNSFAPVFACRATSTIEVVPNDEVTNIFVFALIVALNTGLIVNLETVELSLIVVLVTPSITVPVTIFEVSTVEAS